MKDRLCTVRNWVIAALAATLSLAVASAQPYVYVANVAGNTVAVVNPANHTTVATVGVGASPTGLAVTPNGLFVYVVNQGDNNVSVVSTTTNTVVATVPVGPAPTQVAVTPNGAQVYVVLRNSNQVAVIDTASQTLIATIGVSTRPAAVAFSPDSSQAYVSNLYGGGLGNVSVISTASKSVINTFVTSRPGAIAVLPNGNLYIVHQSPNTVTVHDPSGNLLNTLTGYVSPTWIAATPNGSRLLVTNSNSNSVSVIDAASNSVVANIPVGTAPTAVAISPDGTRAYVTNEYDFSLSTIDVASSTQINTQNGVGAYPLAVAMVPPASGPPPPVCTFSLNPTSASYTAAGGVGNTVALTASPSCSAWTAVSNVAWAQITGGASGNGSGTVTYSVNPNLGAGPLSGTLTIAGQTFTINQAGLACSYSLSLAGTSVGSGATNGSVNVIAGSGCGWNAQSNAPSWLTVTGGFSGSGNGTVSFSIASNPGTSGRNGTLTIGGQTYTVLQAGVAFSPIRVNCGGPQYTDGNNNVWSAGGEQNITMTTAAISGTTTPALYQSEAWSTGTLQYQYAVPNGSFTVKLHFAEFYETQAGRRTFNIVVNGTTYNSSYDIFAVAGSMAAVDVSIPVVVNNGQILVQLVPVTGRAKLDALEIF